MESLRELNKIVQKPHYKTQGNWMARNIVREAALPFTWIFLRTPITANQITIVSIFTILISAFMFSVGTKNSFFIGALLLEVWYLLDHVDGQVARYRKQVGITGVFLDFLSHYFPHLLIFPCIAIGVLKNSHSIICMYCGIAAAASLCLINLLFDAKCKSFFWGITYYKVKKIKAGKESVKSPASRPAYKKIFSVLYKFCEIHVIMNLLFILGLVFISSSVGFDLVTKILLLFYSVLSFSVFTARFTQFILSQRLDREFTDIFEK